MSDIVERLRNDPQRNFAEAADEIERLRLEIQALKNANAFVFSDAEFQRQCDVMREVLAGYCELKRIQETRRT